jgi:hypothetical protein
LIGGCWALGLGRTGLNNETALPFALGGLLVYLRTYFLPPLGVFVLEICRRTRSSALLLTILGLMLLFAVAGSLAAMSRGFFVTAFSPPLLLLMRRDGAAAWYRRRAVPALLVSALVSGIVVSAIGDLRNAGYASGAMSMADTADVLQRDSGTEAVRASGWEQVATLATERVGGISQLLAVSGCRVRGVEPAWGLIVSGDWQWIDRITRDSMGFVPKQDRTAAFGVGFGFWGSLAVTDSLPLLLLGTALFVMLALLVELLFARIGERTTGHVLAALLALMLWGQPTVSDLSRFAFIVLVTLVAVLVLGRRSAVEAGTDSAAAEHDEHVGAPGGERL